MYRANLSGRDKSGAIAAVVAIHAGLLLALLNIAGKLPLGDTQSVLQVFNIDQLKPPPPPPPPPKPQPKQPKAKLKEGGAAPKNIKSEATPVVAPKPKLPSPPTIAATETPRQGTAATQGAAPVPGPGTGAGGTGTGTGAGAGGSGPGGGGEEGEVSPPQLLTPTLTGRDFPHEMLDQWPRGAQIFIRLRIDANGYVIQCFVDRGTGNPTIDSTICNLVRARFRYRPALDRFGRAVAGWAGYRQVAPR